LVRIVASENCSGQDEAFFEYENCLGIGIKL
jgi:hypothetical protein